MKISELISKLEETKTTHGDIQVKVFNSEECDGSLEEINFCFCVDKNDKVESLALGDAFWADAFSE